MACPLRGPDQAPKPDPQHGPRQPRQRPALLQGLLVLAGTLGAGLLLVSPPTGVSAAPGPAATVQEILDGNQVFIEERQAKVRDGAKVPDRLRTGNSRAQVSFRAGGNARINSFSQLRLGTSCFFLTKGQVLVSGPQNGCTRSSRLSVRGTNYVMTVAESGLAELTVLEGQVLVEGLNKSIHQTQDRPTAVFGGNRVSLGADGTVSDRRRLTEADVAALLNGPLFQGFLSPLSAQQALQSFLQQAYPNLGRSPVTDSADAAAHDLQDAVNRLRQQQGRPPFRDLSADLAARNRTYLRPVLQGILTSGNCDHDPNRWRAFQASLNTAALQPSSEVLACGGGPRDWNAEKMVAEWLTSPVHRSILLERPRATSMGCSSLSQGDQTVVACTLWSPGR